ncbi:hypothetical protein EDC56_2457 [Sinobacterium caligoides]|uniref:Uncharacterized protein n=1 Tax=Sinobacterium caligoides TaxID=933926 RepID=A0A3N2DQB2_9GAMM|nr:hypothetical protein EDC56_2457 [Sinobacterium caligoides]
MLLFVIAHCVPIPTIQMITTAYGHSIVLPSQHSAGLRTKIILTQEVRTNIGQSGSIFFLTLQSPVLTHFNNRVFQCRRLKKGDAPKWVSSLSTPTH